MSFWENDDKTMAALVLPNFDFDLQTRAIHDLLQSHRMKERALNGEIEGIRQSSQRASGLASMQLENDYVDTCEYSVYLSAAHSMAAVGMLAPLAESLFLHAFLGIRDKLHNCERLCTANHQHTRWKMKEENFWDCAYAGAKKGTLDGIKGLSEATGLAKFLPTDLWSRLAALFEYRNKMFHQGFEWLPSELEAFRELIPKNGWPSDWFGTVTSGDSPRAFYLTDAFVDECLTTIERVHDGIGTFVRKNIASTDKFGQPGRPE